jgi:hypothetical protein
VIWFEVGGRKLSDQQLHDLVERGRTRAAKLVVDGRKQTGRLVLDANAATPVRFESK